MLIRVLIGLIAIAEPKPRRNWRPYAIIGGLVLSFSFALLGSVLISVLGLPANILRIAGLTC
jgi:small neutral amino acid transporter SnatA (MarC family)